MSPLKRRALLALPALAAPAALRAQGSGAGAAWPERPVRVVIPFPPGSTPDIAGRAVATHFAQAFGQPFLPENRPGAGGNIGTDAVAKATDGHTIGISINGPLSTAPALYPNLPFDPKRDLAPVSLLLRGAQMLVVHPSVPARDLAGFIAHARANPGKLSFGSVGSGSGSHLAMADLMSRAGLEMLHVPYRGFPPAVLDLVAGRIDAMFIIAAGILPQLRDDRARALAVTAEARIPQAPAVPTLAEAGVPDAASYAWIGLVAPAATPAPRVARLAEEARRGLSEPQTRGALEAAGFEVVASSPAEFTRLIAAETERWGGLIARLGIKAEA
ncbi:tripartite tricarboxylate transporter substrate binding protein [Siccirubricoccus sp. G192]|uniref:Bug family tripartite tricarboxylate transporter substrate binding protein n=1 Tax=Siccirubricoccus sp. G192 TaxID=2849651 RepID=UPI001C2C9C2C|nr:tripartite tricarboxylate transporter substrate binding protein [Siccirubricoccus sp. G192]MBV1796058.1 tripartite tricarboxylate transporter substrate binding protein [Siccirubricoccus sp. G192]